MARPKIPLISRRKALHAALQIMDTEGLDGLSIRRLADELGVNGASLYHHFANKEEIVVGATEIALAEVRTPTETDEDWRTWLPRNSRMLRKAMLEHPELVPIIVRKGELGMGIQMMDSSARRLIEEGVPIGAVAPLLDALEMFAIGSAIHETRGGDDDGYSSPNGEESLIAKAARSSSLSPDELYEIVSTAIVTAVEEAAAANAKSAARRPSTRRAAVKAVPKAAVKAVPKAAVKSAVKASPKRAVTKSPARTVAGTPKAAAAKARTSRSA